MQTAVYGSGDSSGAVMAHLSSIGAVVTVIWWCCDAVAALCYCGTVVRYGGVCVVRWRGGVQTFSIQHP